MVLSYWWSVYIPCKARCLPPICVIAVKCYPRVSDDCIAVQIDHYSPRFPPEITNLKQAVFTDCVTFFNLLSVLHFFVDLLLLDSASGSAESEKRFLGNQYSDFYWSKQLTKIVKRCARSFDLSIWYVWYLKFKIVRINNVKGKSSVTMVNFKSIEYLILYVLHLTYIPLNESQA